MCLTLDIIFVLLNHSGRECNQKSQLNTFMCIGQLCTFIQSCRQARLWQWITWGLDQRKTSRSALSSTHAQMGDLTDWLVMEHFIEHFNPDSPCTSHFICPCTSVLSCQLCIAGNHSVLYHTVHLFTYCKTAHNREGLEPRLRQTHTGSRAHFLLTTWHAVVSRLLLRSLCIYIYTLLKILWAPCSYLVWQWMTL